MPKVQKKGAAIPPAKLSAEERAQLRAEYVKLEEQRLDLQRQSETRAKAQSRIERQLTEQLQLDKKWDQKLGKDFEFGIEMLDGSLYYKGELIAALGEAEFDRRVKDAPKRPKFYLRDNRPPEPAKSKPARGKGRKTA